MGRQVGFYMLPDDCSLFVRFAKERDPAVQVIPAESNTPELAATDIPCSLGQRWYLWNPSILKTLRRLKISGDSGTVVYRIDTSDPVIEMLLPAMTAWDGNEALTQGRIYTSFDVPSEALQRWFGALASWIRRNFAKSPNTSLRGYVGPSALSWHRAGGILLPTFKPPETPTWKSIIGGAGTHTVRNTQ